MLVIISDLHLSDGTTGKTIGASAFRDFRDRLTELASDASWRSDGTYRPIDNFDLVLLGDVFDLIRTTLWTNHKKFDVRPWDHPYTEKFVNKIQQVIDDTLEANAQALATIRGLRDTPIIIPPAHEGKPLKKVPNSEYMPVPARIHYLVGNHDWFLHLQHPDWPQYDDMRKQVVDAMGLETPHDRPFPHDPSNPDDTYAALSHLLDRHKVFARHGDVHDSINYHESEGRAASSLGDAMVVELFNQFPKALNDNYGGSLPPELLESINRLVNVRPNLYVPIWIDSLLEQYDISQYQANQIKEAWDSLSKRFLDVDYVRAQDTYSFKDNYDITKKILNFADGVSIRQASRIAKLITRVSSGEGSYAEQALKEPWLKSGRANYVVYGHTHRYEVTPLGCIMSGGHPVDQMYFNTGTWMPVYVPTTRRGKGRRFVSYNVMTYVAFFQDDERSGRPYEMWSGTLADKM